MTALTSHIETAMVILSRQEFFPGQKVLGQFFKRVERAHGAVERRFRIMVKCFNRHYTVGLQMFLQPQEQRFNNPILLEELQYVSHEDKIVTVDVGLLC